jgi:hypothetical protein
MIKKTCSFKFVAVFSIFAIVIFTIIEIACIYPLLKGLINRDNIAWQVAMIMFFLSFGLLCVFVGNRMGYTVIYNAETNMLYRRGLFGGYKYELKIEDIQDIVIAEFYKETTYYVLIDPYNTQYGGCTKKSFIRLERTSKNHAFINQFWQKPIIKTVNDYTF